MTTKGMNFDKGISKNEGLISSSLILIQGPNSGASGLDFRANARGKVASSNQCIGVGPSKFEGEGGLQCKGRSYLTARMLLTVLNPRHGFTWSFSDEHGEVVKVCPSKGSRRQEMVL